MTTGSARFGLADACAVAGVLLTVAGTALLSIPAAVILAGIWCLIAARVVIRLYG